MLYLGYVIAFSVSASPLDVDWPTSMPGNIAGGTAGGGGNGDVGSRVGKRGPARDSGNLL